MSGLIKPQSLVLFSPFGQRRCCGVVVEAACRLAKSSYVCPGLPSEHVNVIRPASNHQRTQCLQNLYEKFRQGCKMGSRAYVISLVVQLQLLAWTAEEFCVLFSVDRRQSGRNSCNVCIELLSMYFPAGAVNQPFLLAV